MKTYTTSGTGGGQTLSEIETDKIPVYNSKVDVEADLANLSAGQIVAIDDTGDELAQPVDVVEEGNLHAVTSNAVAESLSYSETEQKTGGTWIDGKPIYRKVVDCGNLPNATSKTVNHNISNFGELVTMFARAYSNNTYLPIPYGSTGDPAIIFITKTGVILSTTSNLSSWTGTKVILEYTKTTD